MPHALKLLDVVHEVETVLQIVLGLVGLLVAWRALLVARDQLLPIASELKQAAATRELRKRLTGELPTQPRDVFGFDPRFTRWDWKRLLTVEEFPPATLTPRLTRSYSEFYRDLHERLEAGSYNQGVLVIDLMLVPQLLAENLITPLTSTMGLDLDTMLRQRARLTGVRLEYAPKEMVRQLCSNEAGVLGALPLWINTHGRMIPDDATSGDHGGPLPASYDDLLDHEDAATLLLTAGVQSYYLIFELYAHLAYRGCQIPRALDPAAATSSLLDPASDDRRGFNHAIADLAVRLHFYRSTKDLFRNARAVEDFHEEAFRLEHAGDARMIRERLARWKPVFSSELLWRTLPQRNATEAASLADETSFRLPFVRHSGNDSWSYMSALGGFGLALPSAAKNDEQSARALTCVFLCNPLIMHPYVDDMLPAESEEPAVVDFVKRHARPRWALWPTMEKALVDTVYEVLLLLPRDEHDQPRAVWNRYVQTLESSDAVRERLGALISKVEEIAHASRVADPSSSRNPG